MNDIIRIIADNGLSEQFRTLCIVGGAVALVVCAFWYGPRIGLNKRKVLISLVIAYPLLYGLMELIYAVSKYLASIHFMGIDTAINSGIKIFAIFPVISLFVSKLLKVEWNKIADLFAVARLIEYPVDSIGCIFTGCCTGYPCSWGIYNPTTGENDFPIQILNSLIMCLIFIVLIRRAKKNEFISDGKQLPLVLILFGSTRFFTEFLMDNEKVFLGISVIAGHCIIMCIVGAVTLVVINHKQKALAEK